MSAGCRFVGFLQAGDPRWEAALARVAHDFFHDPAYVGACAGHEGGEPLLFLADAGDRGLAVPLVRHSLREFGPAFAALSDVRSPYGYPGPLEWGRPEPGAMARLYRAFVDHLHSLDVVSVFLRMHPFLPCSAEDLAALGDLRRHGPVVYLDLRDPEASWRGITPQNRRYIRAAVAAGWTVRHDDWTTLDLVVDAYHQTMRRLGAAPYYFFRREFFLRLRDAGRGQFHLATALDPGGEVAGGLFYTEAGGLVHGFLCGVREAWLHHSPTKLLNDAVRLRGIQRGCHTFNLGGGLGARADGVLQFKLRFSKLTHPFMTFRAILRPDAYQALVQGLEATGSGFFPAYRDPLALGCTKT